jgi:uncharacterized coiled-coil protein SlyX
MATRKVVGRKIALVLGIVSILLAITLVIALAVYLPTSAQIDTLNAQIAQQKQTIAGLNLQITALRSQIDSLNATRTNTDYLENQITNLEQQIQSLYNVVYLNASAFLVNNQAFSMEPSTNFTIWDQPDTPLQYAGYVTVEVQSSSNLTFVQVQYNSFGVAYDNVVTLGNGTVAFPALPGPVVIALGNTEPTDSVTGTATAIYHY